MRIMFEHVGSTLDRSGDNPESSHFDLYKCGVCFATVFRDDCLSHRKWHESLSPAPMREDASYEAWSEGVGKATEGVVSRGRDRILAAARRDPDQCGGEHEWPPEITPYSKCQWCGLNYKDWRAEHEG